MIYEMGNFHAFWRAKLITGITLLYPGVLFLFLVWKRKRGVGG
jgi:hypothetical protein